MSIITRFRRVRQQAKEHKAAEQKEEAKPARYQHVPVHAASDAVACAPSGNRVADYARVRQVNHERSDRNERSSKGKSRDQHVGIPPILGVPRVGSSMSTATYATSESYSHHHPRVSTVTSSSVASSSRSVSYKGKEVDRSPYHTPHLSLASSKGGDTQHESRRHVPDKLEARPYRSTQPVEPINTSRPHTAVGHPHRLHPSARSPSEVSVDRSGLAQVAKLASTPIAQRHSRSQNVPPHQQQTPTKSTMSESPSPYGSPPNSHSRNPNSHSSFWERHSRQGSVSSLPALTPTSTKHHSAGPITPRRSSVRHSSGHQRHHSLEESNQPLLDFDFQFDDKVSLNSVALDSSDKNEQRRASRTRYQEKEIIDPSVGLLDFGLSGKKRDSIPSSRSRSSRAPDPVASKAPEPSYPPITRSRTKSWKLPKAGSKLLRKNHKSSDSK